jgi:hypothetical protein
MNTTKLAETRTGELCTNCGTPLDAKHFDESGFADLTGPNVARELLLASFELRPQYCGVLEFFSQFSDVFAKDNSEVQTPGLRWLILANDRPMYPYLQIEWILNPWGYGSFPFHVRLEEGATIQLVVRRLNGGVNSVRRVGGRLAGRYWYNPAYGDVRRRCS